MAIILALAMALPATANTGATKRVLLTNPGLAVTCTSGATRGTPTEGFAVINFPSNNTVSAEVSVKGGRPDTTFQVSLVQTPSGEGCTPTFRSEATLTTNGQGNGNVHLSEPLRTGTTGAFILIRRAGTTTFAFATMGVHAR